ncbi:MAG: DUF1800 domain-containing protein [Pseudomonadota bacterium]
MSLEDALLDARFGLGPHPSFRSGAEALLAPLTGPDRIAATHPIAPFADLAHQGDALRQLNRARREAATAAAREAAVDARRDYQRAMRVRKARETGALLARAVETRDPMRERLVRFWADHFTVVGRHFYLRNAVENYVEEAIRPNVTGRFSDLLAAAILHPMMVLYLGQASSIGPNSRMGRENPDRGLNENLAREVLELHTLGVDGAYAQADVRQLAELLAGLIVPQDGTLRFAPHRGEPGPEQVLGRRYGRRIPKIEDIHQVLADLARHPDTARHIARKLAVHFVSDTPSAALVAHVAARFVATDGDLLQVYTALVEHPDARRRTRDKVKPPWDFVVTSLRALQPDGSRLAQARTGDVQHHLLRPLADMGQPWEAPTGPDGWPETAAHWVTPQGLAGRIGWAMRLPDLLGAFGTPLPDPRGFADTALGPLAGPTVRFAAQAAETRAEGIALVLLSPEFQRR